MQLAIKRNNIEVELNIKKIFKSLTIRLFLISLPNHSNTRNKFARKSIETIPMEIFAEIIQLSVKFETSIGRKK